MPYKRGGEAEQRGKLRKKAKRRIASLQKEMGKADNERERFFLQQQIDKLRSDIQMTYQINPETHKATGYSRDTLEIAKQNLTRQIRSSDIGSSSQSRKNFLTQQELNNAESYFFIGPTQSEFTEEEVKIFYRATQEAWEGKGNYRDRNRLILEYYGKSDLRSFVREVLDMNKKAVDLAHEGGRTESESEEEVRPDGEENVPYRNEYMSYVISPTTYSFINTPRDEEAD